jgi:cation-transporting ATPase E
VSRSLAQTAVTTVSIMCGLVLILFVQPQGELISKWRDLHWRHAALAVVLTGMFAIITLVPGLRAMFELQLLSVVDYVLLALVVGLWAVCLHWTWRWRLLDRLLRTTSATRNDASGAITPARGWA